MIAERFDTLSRSLSTGSSRRSALAAVLGGSLGLLGLDSIEAKKKKACSPCKKRKKGKCKGTLPDQTPCAGGTCQGGSCIAPPPPPPPPPLPCGGCPSGQTCLSNGSCAIPCPTGDGDCPFNRCASCDRNAEQTQYCSAGLTAPCAAYQVCTLPAGTSSCPKGTQCQPCLPGENDEDFCIPLCTG